MAECTPNLRASYEAAETKPKDGDRIARSYNSVFVSGHLPIEACTASHWGLAADLSQHKF